MACRSYLTEGLRTLNDHRELVWTLALNLTPDPNGDDPLPSSIVGLLEGILPYAARGVKVNEGDRTRLDPTRGVGLFGREDFRGILYVPCTTAVATPDALQCVVLTTDELMTLERMGAVRVMASLGQLNRFFPTTIWIDPARQSVAKYEELRQKSILGKIGPWARVAEEPALWVWFQLRSVDNEWKKEHNEKHRVTDRVLSTHQGAEQRCLITYSRTFCRSIKALGQQASSGGALGLFSDYSHEAKRILTYNPNAEQRGVAAIAHPDGQNPPEDPTQWISFLGNYVLLCEAKEQEMEVGARLVEDGFVCVVPSLSKLIDDLAEGRSVSFDEISKEDYLPLVFEPVKEPTLPQLDVVDLAHVQLLSPEEEIQAAFGGEGGVDAIAKFIDKMKQVVCPVLAKARDCEIEQQQQHADKKDAAASVMIVRNLAIRVETWLTPDKEPTFTPVFKSLGDEDGAKAHTEIRQELLAKIVQALKDSAASHAPKVATGSKFGMGLVFEISP